MAHGHIGALWHDQPIVGPVSIVLRAPFAALAQLGSDSTLLQYRLGPAAACSPRRCSRSGSRTRPTAAEPTRRCVRCSPLGLLFNPLTLAGARLRPPRGAARATAGCGRDRARGRARVRPAIVVLGVAVATKQWALLALGPVLLAAPAYARIRIALVALAIGALLFLPPSPATRALPRCAAGGRPTARERHADNVWWPFTETAPDQALDPSIDRRAPSLR